MVVFYCSLWLFPFCCDYFSVSFVCVFYYVAPHRFSPKFIFVSFWFVSLACFSPFVLVVFYLHWILLFVNGFTYILRQGVLHGVHEAPLRVSFDLDGSASILKGEPLRTSSHSNEFASVLQGVSFCSLCVIVC